MDIIYVLVPLSIVLILIAILIFSWSVKGVQFDDLDSPAHRILFDDDDPLIPGQQKTKAKTENQQTPSND